MFRKAERRKAKLRMALLGPSGAGKTYSALLIASGLGNSIAMIDTENGSGELYSDLCDYDVCTLTAPFTPQKYIHAIKEAEKAGYEVMIIDSLSHAWAGQGGLLEEVDKRKASQKNQFTAWRDVTPMHNSLVDAIVQNSCHVIATMRSKTAYDVQKDEKGNTRPVKIGQAPIQRDGMEYEFTLVMDLENEKHIATPSKDRTSLLDGHHFVPSPDTGKVLKHWLESGAGAEQDDVQKQIQDQAANVANDNHHADNTLSQNTKATQNQVNKIHTLCTTLGFKDKENRIKNINIWLQQKGRQQVQSTNELDKSDASELIDLLQGHVDHMQSKADENQKEAAHA